MADNNVTLIGNVVETPDVQYTAAARALAKVRFAVNRRWRDRNQEWQEETSFFTGTCWGDLATNVHMSLNKGDRVVIVGRLEQRSWETTDGDQRSVVEVQIDDIGPSLRWATATVDKVEQKKPRFEAPQEAPF